MTTEVAARAFVLKLGRGLHAHGYPSPQLEESLARISRRLGLEGQFFSTPTALFASFGHDEPATYQLRVEPGDVNLEKLVRLDAVTEEVAAGRLTPAQGGLALEEALAALPRYGSGLTLVGFALASATAARFFGGSGIDVASAGGVGLLIGLLALAASRIAALGRVFEPLAAALAAFVTVALFSSGLPLSVFVVTLAGLILLVPGLTLTVAMTELASRHLVSGTARLAGTGGAFLVIGFGVALGTRVGERLFGSVTAVAPTPLPEWTLGVALLLAPLGFVVLLKAPAEHVPGIVVTGLVGFAGARAGAHLIGPELGAFVGALAVGLASNVYARWRRCPAAVTQVPGILILVPGSLGFRSLSSLMAQQTLVGVETAFQMTLVAVSLATGLLFANALLAPRAHAAD